MRKAIVAAGLIAAGLIAAGAAGWVGHGVYDSIPPLSRADECDRILAEWDRAYTREQQDDVIRCREIRPGWSPLD